jgi:chorismate synthase
LRFTLTSYTAPGVVAEAMVALVLAEAMIEKFGGDSISETRRNLDGYLAAIPATLTTAVDDGRG